MIPFRHTRGSKLYPRCITITHNYTGDQPSAKRYVTRIID